MPCNRRHHVLGFEVYQTITLVASITKRSNDESTEHGSGGAVVALSLGLASLGTGIGLTANESPVVQAQPGGTVGGGGGGGSGAVSFSSAWVAYVHSKGGFGFVSTSSCQYLPPDNNNLDLACLNYSSHLTVDLQNFHKEYHTFPSFTIYYNVNDQFSYDLY